MLLALEDVRKAASLHQGVFLHNNINRYTLLKSLVLFTAMAHPVLWPKNTFFYPIGNTSAISLTETLPPEEPGTILLLGCGDPRSILFTVHSETTLSTSLLDRCCFTHLHKLHQSTGQRKLDFTCCDAEPAVLGMLALFSKSTYSFRF